MCAGGQMALWCVIQVDPVGHRFRSFGYTFPSSRPARSVADNYLLESSNSNRQRDDRLLLHAYYTFG